jgi:hypothetical protein
MLEHSFHLAIFYPSSLASSEATSILLVDFVATALPDARCEWPTVTMLLGVVQYDALNLLHHWILEVGVKPSVFLVRIQQASPELFPVCGPLGYWHVLPVFYMLAQGVLPPL